MGTPVTVALELELELALEVELPLELEPELMLEFELELTLDWDTDAALELLEPDCNDELELKPASALLLGTAVPPLQACSKIDRAPMVIRSVVDRRTLNSNHFAEM